MIYLIIVSIIWALSFSLIKGSLTSIDPILVALLRLVISLIIFIPFLRLKKLSKVLVTHLLIIGSIQYGLMYISYIYSYQYLQAYEIAILTIFTPLFVVAIHDIWTKEMILRNWVKAILAVVGAAVIIYTDRTTVGFWKGVILIQISNLLFAMGQIYYKKIMERNYGIDQKRHYALLFLGGVIISAVFSLFSTDFSRIEITFNQFLIILYLGGIASGVGFFLWNLGVTKVQSGTLAVMNNIKIPLGVLFALIILNETVNYTQFIIGFSIIIIALQFDRFVKIKGATNKT